MPPYVLVDNVADEPTAYISRAKCQAWASIYHTWCVQVVRSPKEAFPAAMQSWRERCEKCVCLQGDYIEK